MRDYVLNKWELAILTFFGIFGALCFPGELLGSWGGDTIARFVAATAAAIVAVVARWRRERDMRSVRVVTVSAEWRTVPDVTEYAKRVLDGPVTTQLGGLLIAAGLPVSPECEYKVLIRVKEGANRG